MSADGASIRREPSSLDAEQAVLGSVLMEPNSLHKCISSLNPEDFYYPNHRYIFESYVALADEGAPIDLVSVSSYLSDRDLLDKVGGLARLAELSSSIRIHNFDYYVEIVLKKSRLRQLIRSFKELQALCYSEDAEVDAIINLAAKWLQDVREGSGAGDFAHIGKVILRRINELMELSKNKQRPLQETGFASLDHKIGGLRKGALMILAARPGMGKSALAFNIAQRVASIYEVPTAIFSLEMSSEEVSTRFLSTYATINSSQLSSGELSEAEWTKLSDKAVEFFPTPIYINDRSGVGPLEMMARCRELKLSEPNLGLVIVDYLQLMSSDSRRTDNRQQEISDISRNLKIMARELNVPVIALSQLSRACEGRSNKRPMLSDLRDSGAIEQDADVVLFLYRDDYYEMPEESGPARDHSQAELIIAKNRHGATGTVYLGWKPEYTLFYDLDPRMQNMEPPPF